MITFKEAHEKDLPILASLYSVINLNIEKNETWTYETALSYINYFYNYQPDLFICAYDEDIPIAAIMSTLKPYYDGMHLELANAKYNVTHIDLITQKNDLNISLDFYKEIGLESNTNLLILNGKLDDCLKNIREEL